MKYTKLLIVLAIIMVSSSMLAQTEVKKDTLLLSTQVDTSVVIVDTIGVVINDKPIKYNWFIGGGVGASIFFGESDRRGPLSGRFTPAIQVEVGHWITPNIGFRFQYSGLWSKGYIANTEQAMSTGGHLAYGELVNGGWYKQKWNYSHLHADLLFDYTNIFCGYKEDRWFSTILYAGLGMIHSPDTKHNNEITMNIGGIARFSLTDDLDLNIDLLATMMHDRYDQEVLSKPNLYFEGQLNLTVGLVYKIKPRGWNRAKTVYINN